MNFNNKNIKAITKHIIGGGIVIMNYYGFIQINAEIYYAFKSFLGKSDEETEKELQVDKNEKAFLESFNNFTSDVAEAGGYNPTNNSKANIKLIKDNVKYVVVYRDKDSKQIIVDYTQEIDNNSLRKVGGLKYKDNKIKIGFYVKCKNFLDN